MLSSFLRSIGVVSSSSTALNNNVKSILPIDFEDPSDTSIQIVAMPPNITQEEKATAVSEKKPLSHQVILSAADSPFQLVANVFQSPVDITKIILRVTVAYPKDMTDPRPIHLN